MFLSTASETIAAISTAPGAGGIAVVRLSGKEALSIADKIFRSPAGKVLSQQPANTIHFGTIMHQNEPIDEVLVSVFRAPHSFTGEDVVEISCHGSLYIQQSILQSLITEGATMARAGEFTQRAFINGKIDLSQAEAVADIIAANSAAAHRMAFNQMRGGFAKKLQHLRTQLLNFASLIELELDFSEEDVEFANRKDLEELAHTIKTEISSLANSFSVGNAIKNGIPVALVGETNVGKSTLLNVLLQEDKALVSDIHGTTRDVIEDTIVIQGVEFRFIDTAGIRETSDTVERMGIERTLKKIEQASVVLWVIDATKASEYIEWLTEKITARATGKIILIFNKLDKISEEEKAILTEQFSQFDSSVERIYISAKNKQNIALLEKALLKTAHLPTIEGNHLIVSNTRHYEALKKSLDAIEQVINGLKQHISTDLLAIDIRNCMRHLGEITGEITENEILGNIFSKFCIGK